MLKAQTADLINYKYFHIRTYRINGLKKKIKYFYVSQLKIIKNIHLFTKITDVTKDVVIEMCWICNDNVGTEFLKKYKIQKSV